MGRGTVQGRRVSRETRLLLTTVFLAVVCLWVLARVRFPDRPAPPTPVQPILTQLAPRPTFDDLAADIAQLLPRVEPLIVPFEPWASESAVPGTVPAPLTALRIGGDAAVALVDETSRRTVTDLGEYVVRIDPASRLALVLVPGPPAPPPVSWSPSQPQRPRYLIVADVAAGGLSLRPVFVSSLASASGPAWPGGIWIVPPRTDLVPGSVVFTPDALLVGLVVNHDGGRAIVPGEVLLAAAERLRVPRVSPPGQLGIQVQALTAKLARATGAGSGVVVTRVDSDGTAAGIVAPGDVLESIDGETLSTPLHWNARVARLAAGETLNIRLLRGSTWSDVALVAAPIAAPPAVSSLGLTLRTAPGTGATVVAVERGSIAERAGIRADDLITFAAGIQAPSAAEIRRAFAAAQAGRALLVTLSRGNEHLATALEK